MFKNYLKIAIRNLFKDKYYASINIFGLAIGMSCAMLVIIYILREESYDTKFSDSDRIYRVSTKFIHVGDFAGSSPSLSGAIRNDMSWVEEVVQITPMGGSTVKYNNKKVHSNRSTLMVDANYFKVFDYPIIYGNPDKILDQSNKIALSKEMSIKIFGADNPVGKQITLNGDPQLFEVGGVYDNSNYLTHLQSDIILKGFSAPNDAWYDVGPLTFIKTTEILDDDLIKSRLNTIIKKNIYSGEEQDFAEWQTSNQGYAFYIYSLKDVYHHAKLKFESFEGGNANNLILMSVIGIFIIFIAAFNFINLSTARTLKRLSEVGVRKTLGSTRLQLIGQFLLESSLICLISALLAVGFAELMLITISQFFTIPSEPMGAISISQLIIVFTLFTIGVTLISSLYPALYVSRFNPIQIMHKRAVTNRKLGLRNVLVVIQFVISISLIIVTITVNQQNAYLRNVDLGFNQENTLIIHNLWNIKNPENFKNEIEQIAGVVTSSIVDRTPGDNNSGLYSFTKENMSYQFESMNADSETIEALDLHLMEGKNFSKLKAYDTTSVIINESAAEYLGLEQPIGKVIHDKFEIIGVVNDFNYESLREKIDPLLIFNDIHNRNNLLVKISQATDYDKVIKLIESKWVKYNQEADFDYGFLDENFGKRLEKETHTSMAMSLLTLISIIISFLGMVGLCAYTIERKTKEIGVRVVMGATLKNIILLIGSSFSKLIVIAFIIAAPIAYYFSDNWLSNFALHTNMDVFVFLGVGVIMIFITWLIISIQSLKTTTLNPSEVLNKD